MHAAMYINVVHFYPFKELSVACMIFPAILSSKQLYEVRLRNWLAQGQSGDSDLDLPGTSSVLQPPYHTSFPSSSPKEMVQ